MSMDVLQIVIPSVVALLGSGVVILVSLSANKIQRASIAADLVKIRDELRNQCVVELHRQKMDAYLAVMQAIGKFNTHVSSSVNSDHTSFIHEGLVHLGNVNQVAIQGSIFFAPKTMSGFKELSDALWAFYRVSFRKGEEREKYLLTKANLVRLIREDLGVPAMPDEFFLSLLSNLSNQID